MLSSTIIKIFGAFGFSVAGLVLVFNLVGGDPVSRQWWRWAGAHSFWIVVCGSLMFKFRDRIRIFVLRIKLNWKIKVCLVLHDPGNDRGGNHHYDDEHGPFFWRKGRGSIHNRINELPGCDSIHSVVVFIPMFIAGLSSVAL